MVGQRYADLGGVPGEGEGSDGPDGVKRVGSIVDEQRADGVLPPEPVKCECDGHGNVMVVRDAKTGDYLGNDPRLYLDHPNGIEESTYPCPACRPTQFKRWRAGCGKWDHDRANCELCKAAGDDKRKAYR